jgi:hypothetical protein
MQESRSMKSDKKKRGSQASFFYSFKFVKKITSPAIVKILTNLLKS